MMAEWWHDLWGSHVAPLAEMFPALFKLSSKKDASVLECIAGDGEQWDPGLRPWLVSGQVAHELQIIQVSIPLPTTNESIDKWSWNNDPDGYSVKKFRQVLEEERSLRDGTGTNNFKPKMVWMSQVPPRIGFTMWLFTFERLPTKSRLKRFNILPSDECPFCLTEPETQQHLFISCNYVTAIWNRIAFFFKAGPWQLQHLFDPWERWNPSGLTGLGRNCWTLVPHAILWAVWLERNQRISKHQSRPPEQIVQEIFVLMWCWLKNFNLHDD